MKKVTVILVAVGALVAITAGFEKYATASGNDMKVENAKKPALLGTARNIISIIVQDSVRLLTTYYCPLSKNYQEQLKTNNKRG